MVQMNKASETHAAWVKAGRPRCTHESYDKEYALGSDTGDYQCRTCGISWPRGGPVPPPQPEDEAETQAEAGT